ncbi:T9SS type A sorting domain-containing protein [candidate division WOR-3 bacterium]|nr:T9SS type A sorting domain-containing protein [candidate division WOR-3 bacterium]
MTFPLCQVVISYLLARPLFFLTISKKTGVKLDAYDISGRLIQTIIDNVIDAGEYNVLWDSSSRPSGVYFLKFNAGGYSVTKKLLKLR